VTRVTDATVKPRRIHAMDNVRSTRKYPSYTLAQLETAVAEGRGNPVMIQEIADRKAGRSNVRVVPQIEGGRAQTKVGRL
jgi:hypothetical protein